MSCNDPIVVLGNTPFCDYAGESTETPLNTFALAPRNRRLTESRLIDVDISMRLLSGKWKVQTLCLNAEWADPTRAADT